MGIIQTHTTDIDGKQYACKTFPASEGLVLVPKLISLIGEDIAKLMFVTDEDQLEALFTKNEVMAATMMRIAERAAETDGLLHLKELFKYTTCEQIRVGDAEISASVYDRFDTHFAGDYPHMLKVIWWVARMSFVQP